MSKDEKKPVEPVQLTFADYLAGRSGKSEEKTRKGRSR